MSNPCIAVAAPPIHGPADSLLPHPWSCQQEAGLLASLRHNNVVNFYGVCHSPPCIITGAWPLGISWVGWSGWVSGYSNAQSVNQ